MGYARYPQGGTRGEDYGRTDKQENGRDYGSGRDNRYSSARDDQAAGQFRDDAPYGQREYGNAGYPRGQLSERSYGRQYGQERYARGDEYHGSYASDGRRFVDVGDRRDWDDDERRLGRNPQARDRTTGDRGGHARRPQGYDYDERGFVARAGDEVRSWFGDEDAERRREADARYDERAYGERSSTDRDSDYHNWRRGQIAALDRDYDEYRNENRSKFENEFSTWRSGRQSQRDQLGKVEEHMEIVGSDGSPVGTVDKVRGDRILLTKNDDAAGGRHHSIPSRWIASVDTKVTLTKSADEAKAHWRDEERNQAMFGEDTGRDTQGKMLNRSFSGTY